MTVTKDVLAFSARLEAAVGHVRRVATWYRNHHRSLGFHGQGHKMPDALPMAALTLEITDDFAFRLFHRFRIWDITQAKLEHIERRLTAHLDYEIAVCEEHIERARAEKLQLEMKLVSNKNEARECSTGSSLNAQRCSASTSHSSVRPPAARSVG